MRSPILLSLKCYHSTEWEGSYKYLTPTCSGWVEHWNGTVEHMTRPVRSWPEWLPYIVVNNAYIIHKNSAGSDQHPVSYIGKPARPASQETGYRGQDPPLMLPPSSGLLRFTTSKYGGSLYSPWPSLCLTLFKTIYARGHHSIHWQKIPQFNYSPSKEAFHFICPVSY